MQERTGWACHLSVPVRPPGEQPAGRGAAEALAREGLQAGLQAGGAVLAGAARSPAALPGDVSGLRDPALPALRHPALAARLHRTQPARPLRQRSPAPLTALRGHGSSAGPERIPNPQLDPSGCRIPARQQLRAAAAAPQLSLYAPLV